MTPQRREAVMDRTGHEVDQGTKPSFIPLVTPPSTVNMTQVWWNGKEINHQSSITPALIQSDLILRHGYIPGYQSIQYQISSAPYGYQLSGFYSPLSRLDEFLLYRQAVSFVMHAFVWI